MANKGNICCSYLARILRLTLLAPIIIKTVLDRRQPKGELALADFMVPFSVEWEEQRWRFGSVGLLVGSN
ncbi:MAG TPA: hypothetical protein ENI79_06740 [Rhodospirillales bacterium]|nr:hypothetical protein [Rhodospirillales bacterium]